MTFNVSLMDANLAVFRHAQLVGKHVGRFETRSSSGVLTDLKVGNWELQGIKPPL